MRSLLSFFVLLLVFVTLSQSATLTVTNNLNTGAGSLRNTIAAAASGDTIKFSSAMTITLSSKIMFFKTLTINGDVNLNGKPDDVKISGNSTVLILQTNTTLSLFGLTFTKAGGPGAVWSSGGGKLNVTRCTFNHNRHFDNGGAISTGKGVQLVIIESYFYNNSAVGTGGALSVGGNGTIYRSLFEGNKAGYGGAVSMGGISSLVSIYDTTFSQNWAGFTSYLWPQGGAINVWGNATLNLVRCTLASNDAKDWLNFGNGGPPSPGRGDGVYLSHANSTLKTTGTIFENSALSGIDIEGVPGSTVISNGYNLLTLTPFPSAQPTDQFGATAAAIGLAPLANNGGWTKTHALNAGSLAINNGYGGLFLCLTVPCSDQRGTGFSRKKSTAIDVGAFESSFTS